MTNDWTYLIDADNLVICGPGKLEVVCEDFFALPPSLLVPLPSEVLGTLRQRGWIFALQEGVRLELVSTRDLAHPKRAERHRLHIGSQVSWPLPPRFAEQLYVLAKGKESHGTG
jgi:hypothetical protein